MFPVSSVFFFGDSVSSDVLTLLGRFCFRSV